MSGRVLVTGGAGFIGSHIAEAYLAGGWEVVVLDDLSRGSRRKTSLRARASCGPISARRKRERTIATGRFDVINHHAAQIDVRVSVDQPAFDSEINVVGLVNLLEGAGEGGVGRFIFASSGGVVYGDPEVIPTPETAPKLPVSPYGVSKLSGEYYLRALGALRGFEGIAMRYANVFGPRQDPKSEAGVVSIFVSRLLAGRAAHCVRGRATDPGLCVREGRGPGQRPGQHSAARLRAPRHRRPGLQHRHLAAAQRARAGRIGGGGHGPEAEDRVCPAARRRALPQRARREQGQAGAGWTPEYAFEDGLRELVDWFKKEAR